MDGEDLRLPLGFRFHPTDEELVLHYLCRKCTGLPITSNVIREIDIYKHDPWQLPGMAFYGDKEWYFFSPRDRKYPNGSRPNRAAGSGYWKATGADKPVGKPKPAAIKKALVFYAGKPPRGVKTNWIMHEYRLADVDRSAKKEKGLKLDDWVLCRIYKKKEAEEKLPSTLRKPAASLLTKSTLTSHVRTPPVINTLCFDGSDPPPTLNADSSCSEHVQSPGGTCEREVDSQPRWELGWDIAPDVLLNNIDAIAGGGCGGVGGGGFSPLSPGWRDALQDIFMFMESG